MPPYAVMESTYTIENGVPVIILFSRDYADVTKSYTHKFYDFEPYFWAPAEEAHRVVSHYLVKRVEQDVQLDAKGRNIRKVVTRIPSDVPKVRDATDSRGNRLLSWTDMADFVFDKRFLVDKHIKYAYDIVDGEPIPVDVAGPITPRICYCDIEVVSPPGIFPDPKVAGYPILTIQVMDNITQKIVVFTTDVVRQTDDVSHIICGDERDLIKVYIAYLEYHDPDIIAFWNGDEFDIPYLVNRAKNIRVSLKGFARLGYPRVEIDPRTKKFRVRTGGRANLDMLEAFKKYNIGKPKRESNGLKSVISDKELLKGAAFEYADLGPILQKVLDEGRFNDIIQYCKNDVVALKTIDDTLGLYKFFEYNRFVAGSKIMDSLYNTKIIEMAWLHAGMRPMPTHDRTPKSDEKFKGAFVFEPIPGIHEWVATFDIASLYPTIICAFNVSVDIDNISVKVTKEFMEMREKYRTLKKQGVVGAAEMDASAKSISNSTFGSYGSKDARMYDKEKAQFITSTGQIINKFIRDCCESINKTVAYADTDSAFILPVNSEKEAVEIEMYLNKNLIEWTNKNGGSIPIQIKAEKIFRKLLFKYKSSTREAGKKNYAGRLIWQEGKFVDKLSYMGIAAKRSDSPNIAKDCIITFLTKALMEDDVDGAISYIRDLYISILFGKANILDISLPKSVRALGYDTKNSWVDGIEYARSQFNYVIGEGNKPRLVHLNNKQVVCIDEDFDTSLIKYQVNWKLMADKCIRKKMESYLWSLNMEWNTMIDGQQPLNKWF